MRAHKRRNVTGVRRRLPAFVLMLVVAALCIAGVIYKGAEVTQVNVNDGGIWVTNKSKQLVGHLDYEARILDGALRTEATNFDVGQAGETVTVSDLGSLTVAPVNVTQVALGSPTALPAGSSAMQGGDVLGVLNAADGTLWTTSAASPSPSNLVDSAALASNMGASAFVTGEDGSVYSLSNSGTLTTVKRSGSVDQAKTTQVTGIPDGARLSITAVGDQVVALDSASNTLFLPGNKTLDLGAAGIEADAVLQQAGPKDDSVLMATATSLVAIPLTGGQPVITPAAEGSPTGIPAAPVRHEGCAYGAWSGSGAYVRSCKDPASNEQMVVDTLVSAREVVFRTNRKAIVLNDVAEGNVWLPDSNMVLMDNWDEVENQLEESEEEQDSPELTNEVADPQQREENTPPEAVDDEFGIRPGRSTILPVLDNDSDLDGDVLTVTPTTQPGWGSVVVARSGRALQIEDVSADQSGSTSFTYDASDGRASASAHVQVTIHPYGQNEAPTQVRSSSVKIGVGAQIQYQALSDWRDPDGDPIYLKEVQAPTGLNVSFVEDGTVTIAEEGASAGPKTVVLTVADDQGAEARGELVVNVQEAGNLPPSANGDLFQAQPGETVTLDPLKNDTDPNGDPLSLAAVSGAPSGATLTPDLDRGTIDFRAQQPGSYSFAYTVSDGIATTLGIIRVEVVASSSVRPIAENDTAVLPQGGSVLINPLGNDYDPAGGMLSVTSVDTTKAPDIEVALIERHLLRITAHAGIDKTVTFSYTVSNGQGSATAEVTVIPGASDRSDMAPVLRPDRAKVRVGDVGTVSVLSNDRSPAGLNLQVESTLEYDQASAVGTPFVTGNQVRLEAGTSPGLLEVTYSVIDSAGNHASSTVTFEVIPDSDSNEAPRPRTLNAWTSAGQAVTIPVTLSGIDPDGDSVTLVGVDSSPTQGVATASATWIDYTPNRGAVGTDTFTYTVEDRKGARASARVRVAISPSPTSNQNPVAVPDTVQARPDRVLNINVLSNDVDPDGDTLTLDEGGLTTATPALNPQVRSATTISVRTPSEPGNYAVAYTVSDGRGGSATGLATIYVSEDVPLKAPVARDDYVAYTELPEDGSAVRVRVVDNDDDPDGSVDELKVTTGESGVNVSGQDLLIPVSDQLRLVVYTITDRDGLTNSAVVTVPGRNATAPFLNNANLPIEVDAGSQRTISLADYVIVRSGRSAQLVEGSSPAAQAGLTSVSAEGATQLTISAAESFSGNTAFTIQVSDGDDAGALSSSLSVPVRVRATQNQPPTFTPTGVRVEAGGEAVTQNLALGVTDPEGGDPSTFTYSVGTVPDGISASVSGSTLTVTAAQGTARGPAGSIAVSVTDTDGNSVSGSVPVEVVASSKPHVSAPDYQERARVDETVRVDVASRAINPFPDSPLTLEGAVVGLGAGRVHAEGTVVSITPDAVGTIKVTYRLNDYLGDPSRSAQGNITVTVVGAPDAPTGVRAEARGTSGARVTFTPGATNGATVTGYRVLDADSGQQVSATCTAGSCTVDGLSAGRGYSFSVVATSSEGDSKPSAASNRITTVGKPSQMVAPKVEAGDSVLKVSWVAPESDGGSKIDHYEVQVNTDEPITVHGLSTTLSVVNGRDYAVRVRAVNGEGQAGPWSSPTSGHPHPSHVAPDEPVVTVTTERWEGQGVIVAKVFVSWTVGNSGGSGWGQTTINVNGESQNVTGDTRKLKVVLEDSATTATVTVTVRNLEGDATTSAPQTVRIPPNPNTPPFEIDPPTITATGNSGQLHVTNVNVKPGRGYVASDLAVFWGKSGAECADKARANDENRKVQGTNFVWNGGAGSDGVAQDFYFCQISTSGLVSSAIRVSGTPRNDHAAAPVPPDKDWANIPIHADYASYPDGGFAVGIRRTREIEGLCTYGCRLKVVDSASGQTIYKQSDAVISPTETPALRVLGSELPNDGGYKVALFITLSTGKEIIKYMH